MLSFLSILTLRPASARAQGACELAPDSSTVALWHFNEAQGQIAYDSSGNGRDLTLGPTAAEEPADPAWVETPFGHGLYFTSADQDYASGDESNTFPTNQLSVELWIQPIDGDGVDGYAQIFTAGFVNCFVAIQLGTGSGVDRIDAGVGDGFTWEIGHADLGDIELDDGQWHYIAATYDGNTLRIFLDGSEVYTLFDSAIQLAEPHDYKVGGRPLNTFLEGSMDEIRLSDVARTPVEILNHWTNAQSCLSPAPLVGSKGKVGVSLLQESPNPFDPAVAPSRLSLNAHALELPGISSNKFDFSARVVWSIYTSPRALAPVRSLVAEQALNQKGKHSVSTTWDGKNTAAADSPDGSYSYQARLELLRTRRQDGKTQVVDSVESGLRDIVIARPFPLPPVPSDWLSPPIINEPLYSCGDWIRFSGASRDSIVEILVWGVPVASVSARLGWGEVQLPRRLLENDVVTAVQYIDSLTFSYPSREEVIVQAPTYPLFTPWFLEPLYDCQKVVVVAGVWHGATALLARDYFGDRFYWENAGYPNVRAFHVGEIHEGEEYDAMHTYCIDPPRDSSWTWEIEDDWGQTAVVQPVPGELPRPEILEPLNHGHDFATVQNLLPGAMVDIYSTDGNTRVGGGFSDTTRGMFKIIPPLDENFDYYAIQSLCEIESEPSTAITPRFVIPAPSIPGPLCNDFYVEVCDVVPYATVTLYLHIDDHYTRIAQATGEGCMLLALGGNRVLALGDKVVAQQSTAFATSDLSEEREVVSDGSPPYNPDFWNGDSHISNNACYDYAVDKRNDLRAIPGVAGGYQIPPQESRDFQCPAIIEAVLADGLLPSSRDEPCPGCSHKVALFVSPWIDTHNIPYKHIVGYHFYRQDQIRDGVVTWSHKYGDRRATNKDRSGNVIYDPEQADRDYSDLENNLYEDYYEFCGYFCVDKTKVNPLPGVPLSQ